MTDDLAEAQAALDEIATTVAEITPVGVCRADVYRGLGHVHRQLSVVRAHLDQLAGDPEPDELEPAEPVDRNVASAIERRMDELHITKAELIRTSNVSAKSLDAYLAGRPIRRRDKERDLAQALGWPPDTIQRIRRFPAIRPAPDADQPPAEEDTGG